MLTQERLPGSQKQRTGLPHRGAAGTLSIDENGWLHSAPFHLPKQALACRDEAPHRGAQSDVSSASTGRPEIAAQRSGFIPAELEASTAWLRSSPPGGHRLNPAPGTRRSHVSGTTAWDGAPCNSSPRCDLSTHTTGPPSGHSRRAPQALRAPRWVRGWGFVRSSMSNISKVRKTLKAEEEDIRDRLRDAGPNGQIRYQRSKRRHAIQERRKAVNALAAMPRPLKPLGR